MKIIEFKLHDIPVTIIQKEELKFAKIEIFFAGDFNYEEIYAFNVLLWIMLYSMEKFPDKQKIDKFLNENYKMDFEVSSHYYNDCHVIKFCLSGINYKYVNDKKLLEKMVDFLEEVIFKPLMENGLFNEKVFQQQVKQMVEVINAKKNLRGIVVEQNVKKIFGNDNPYGLDQFGQISNYEKLTLEEVSKLYYKLLKLNAFIYVTGDFEEKEIRKLLDNKLTKLSNKDCQYNVIRKEDWDFKYSRIEDKSEFNQSEIASYYYLENYIGNEYNALVDVFTELVNQILFEIIREKKGMCYFISAYRNFDLGILYIKSNIEYKNYNFFLSEVDKIFNKLKKGGYKKIFKVIKKKILDNYITLEETPSNISEQVFINKLLNYTYDIEEEKKKVKQITIKDIKKIAQNIKPKLDYILREKDDE